MLRHNIFQIDSAEASANIRRVNADYYTDLRICGLNRQVFILPG